MRALVAVLLSDITYHFCLVYDNQMIRSNRRRAARGWDVYATTLSAACIIHCLGLPLLAAFLPVFAQSFDDHLLHVVLVALAAPVTLWVIWSEDLAERGALFVTVALSGLALMVIAVAVEPLEQYEVPLTVSGGSLLASAHIWRWFHHRGVIEEDG